MHIGICGIEIIYIVSCIDISVLFFFFKPILTGTAAVGSGLTWHRTLPLCAVGGDHKIFFWVTEM